MYLRRSQQLLQVVLRIADSFRLPSLQLLLLIAYSVPTWAADISLTVRVDARDDQVTVSVANTGKDQATDVSVQIELRNQTLQQSIAEVLAPGATRQARFTVEMPTVDGSYILYSSVFYRNDGQRLSVLDAGYFNVRKRQELGVPCAFPSVHLAGTGEVTAPRVPPHRLRLFLPEEILTDAVIPTKQQTIFRIKNTVPSLNSNYSMFLTYEGSFSDGTHGATICSARLITAPVFTRQSFYSSWLVALFGLAGFFGSFLLFRSQIFYQASLPRVATIRWLFSIGIVSGLYLGFRHLHLLAEVFLPQWYTLAPEHAVPRYLWNAGLVVLRWWYFQGNDYDTFFRWVADPLYTYMLLLNWVVLRYLIRPSAPQEKYCQLLSWVFTRTPLRYAIPIANRSIAVDPVRVKVAVLALAVKAFYLPLLCSWAYAQYTHLFSLPLTTNYFLVNAWLVEFFIFIDVTVFAFGYLTELPQLKNQIRSVEPTILGWVVCIMCYPPFNSFSFAPFDQPLTMSWGASTGLVHAIAIGVITVLWGVYVWATIALGPRSSNLTNRGIVSWGPYRYFRHPAYVSKVSLWAISAAVLGTYNFFLVIAFIVVYALRAWTEERHLSLDPDYLEYKKSVPWRLLPRIW